MNEYEIRADIRKNRLYVTLRGFFNEADAKEMADKAIQEIKKLKPGFDVINDISNFKPGSQQSTEELKRAAIFMQQHGADRMIRVVPATTIGSMQFARNSGTVGYDVDIASSVEEAEEMLGIWWLKSARNKISLADDAARERQQLKQMPGMAAGLGHRRRNGL